MILRHSPLPVSDALADADDPPDRTLLRRYVEHKSQAAFDRLIRRHLGLVYATCRREVGDPDLAEDVTQAVFLILAKKAPRLRGGDGLAGWLFQTARFAARNAARRENSRWRHEQGATEGLLSGVSPPDGSERNHAWQAVEPFLNAAVARLRPADREAILLRFFEGHALAEVGARLGVSENAARMRVARAVERLRRHLAREGAVLSGTALAALLAGHAAQAAPVPGVVLPPAGLVAAKAAQLASGVLHAMGMKTATAFASLLAVAAVVTTVAVAADYRSPNSGVDWSYSDNVPHNLTFRQGLYGWDKEAPNSKAPDYAIRADPRGPAPAQPSAALSARVAHPRGYGTLIQGVRADLYRGHRIRFSAMLRTDAVAQGAGLWLRLDGPHGDLAWNPDAKPIHGTTAWHRYGYVMDIPPDALGMAFGSTLTGTGTVWLADVRLKVVGRNVAPTTEYTEEVPGDTPREIHAWDLTQVGRYREAEAAALAIVSDPDAPSVEECSAREALAHSEMHLGRIAEARADLARFNAEAGDLPIDPSMVNEAHRLAKRLSAPNATPPPASAHTRPSPRQT